MNKNIAIRKLEKAAKDLNNKALMDNSCERWLENKAIERGNEIRIYKGKKFLRIK